MNRIRGDPQTRKGKGRGPIVLNAFPSPGHMADTVTNPTVPGSIGRRGGAKRAWESCPQLALPPAGWGCVPRTLVHALLHLLEIFHLILLV